MAIKPNKVVIPKDYTTRLYGSGHNTAFTSTNTVTIDKTDDYSDIHLDYPAYNMVGEFEFTFPTTTISVANTSNINRYLRCQISVNNTLDRYRYIRFIFEPNVTYRNTGSVSMGLFFSFTLVYNGTRYGIAKNLAPTSDLPAGFDLTTSKYSFIFDTVGKTLTDITSTLGTDSWAE